MTNTDQPAITPTQREIGPILQWPVSALWNLTDSCNLACPYCLNSSSPDLRHALDTASVLRIADLLGKSGVTAVSLLGGEPVSHPGFELVSRRLVDCGLQVGLVTNGLLLKGRRLQSLLSLGASLVAVQLSLHRADEYEHYEYLIKTLRGAGINIFTFLVVDTGDVEAVAAQYRKIAKAGATAFMVAPIGRIGRAANPSSGLKVLGVGEISRLLYRLKSIQDAEGFETIPAFEHRGRVSRYLSEGFGLEELFATCKAAIAEFQIRADGRCAPCSFSIYPTHILHFALVTRVRFRGYPWNGPEFGRFREDKMRQGDKSKVLPRFYSCYEHRKGRCRPCLTGPSDCDGEIDRVGMAMAHLDDSQLVAIDRLTD